MCSFLLVFSTAFLRCDDWRSILHSRLSELFQWKDVLLDEGAECGHFGVFVNESGVELGGEGDDE